MVGVRTAVLQKLRLLIACLLLAVAARPAAVALETPRAVTVLVASAGVLSQEVERQRAPIARAASRACAPRPAVVSSPERTAPLLVAAGEAPFRGALPLYLANERFLL